MEKNEENDRGITNKIQNAMKRHVSKTLLALAFGLLSVGSFVGCKDYDEDVYVDLKSRLSKETSLREALQIQVNELEAFVKTLKSCECDMEAYLTKLEADKTYMKKGDYADQIAQIAKNKAAIELLQKAIDDINDRLDNLDLKDDRVDNLVQQISDMNGLISQVKATADEALKLAKEGKCECNLTQLENRVKTLEDLIAGWDEKVKDLNLKTDKALALATKDSILLVQQKKTLDSLIVVVDDLKQGLTNQIMSVVNQYMTNNNYITKNDVTKIVQNILKDYYTKTEVDNILNNLVKNDYLTKNYYTKDEVLALINSIEIPGQVDLSNILRRLADLEGAPAVDAYTKAEINSMLAGYVKPADLNNIYNRLSNLEANHFWTEDEIRALIPSVYTKTEVDNKFNELKQSVYLKSETYSKTEIDALIDGIQIPGAYNDQWIKDTLENFYIKDSLYTKGYINALQKMLQNTDSIIKITADSALKVALANADSIMDHSSRIGTLERQMSDVLDSVASLKNRVDSIEKRVTTLEDKVKDLEDRVDVLEKFVNKVKADIQNMITGIIVQATENPVIGYLNTPLDARSTLLGVYFGEPMNDWNFPATSDENYISATDFAKLEKNFSRTVQILGTSAFNQVSGGSGEVLVTKNGDSYEGNAGTLYLTVNPSNVDFAGQTLKLMDSRDNACPATLTPLKSSDRLLTFGYTRAGGNGFYETTATIDPNSVDDVKFEIDFAALEEDVKSMVKSSSVYSVVDLSANLIKNFQAKLPAYAVTASWKDSVNQQEHKLYSQYNVATAAVKPFSFAFLQDVKLVSKAPGIEQLEDLAGEIIRKINLNISTDLPDFTNWAGKITFEDFDMPNISDDKFKVTLKKTFTQDDIYPYIEKYFGSDFRIDAGRNGIMYMVFDKEDNGGTYKLVVEHTYTDGSKRYTTFKYNKTTGKFTQDGVETANVKLPLEFTVEVEIDKNNDAREVMQQVLDAVNAKVGANGSLSAQVTSLLNDVAAIGNLNEKISISVNSTKDDIKASLDRYLTRLNNKLTGYVNRVPSIFHIVLMASDGTRAGILSQTKNNPTNAAGKSSLTLYPTTYNLELLTPAYKKFVAVSDVYKADGTEADISVAQTANGGNNMARVIDGDAQCTLNGQSGYIYEVMYTAIDYFGKISLKKYYVRF
jgi:hypothetical protein